MTRRKQYTFSSSHSEVGWNQGSGSLFESLLLGLRPSFPLNAQSLCASTIATFLERGWTARCKKAVFGALSFTRRAHSLTTPSNLETHRKLEFLSGRKEPPTLWRTEFGESTQIESKDNADPVSSLSRAARIPQRLILGQSSFIRYIRKARLKVKKRSTSNQKGVSPYQTVSSKSTQ